MIDLYHHGMSVCAAKVRFALGENKIAWESRYVDLHKGDQFAPDYVKLNPKAVVPTLLPTVTLWSNPQSSTSISTKSSLTCR
jgi:glutathione S-transferase